MRFKPLDEPWENAVHVPMIGDPIICFSDERREWCDHNHLTLAEWLDSAPIGPVQPAVERRME